MDPVAASAMGAIVAPGRIRESGPSAARRNFERRGTIDDEQPEVTMQMALKL